MQVLPDMAGWVSLGPAEVDGQQAHMWQLKEMQGEKVNTYTFYVAEVRLDNNSIGCDVRTADYIAAHARGSGCPWQAGQTIG
jgi:hypothetical protein